MLYVLLLLCECGGLRCGANLLGELVVFGRECLAVAAPGRVELDEHVFRRVVHDLVERLRHHYLHVYVIVVVLTKSITMPFFRYCAFIS